MGKGKRKPKNRIPQAVPAQDSRDHQVIPIRKAMSKLFDTYVGVGICKEDKKAFWFAKGNQELCHELAGQATSDLLNAIWLLRAHLSSDTLYSLITALKEAGALTKHVAEGIQKQLETQQDPKVELKEPAEEDDDEEETGDEEAFVPDFSVG